MLFGTMLQTAIAGAIRGAMTTLHMNPRNLRLYFIAGAEKHLIARIDAKEVKELLEYRGARKLRITMGDVSYEVSL